MDFSWFINNWLELVGYLGSILVAFSLMMVNLRKLRWWNLVGASTFTLYGALIGAWPVALLNAWIVVTNIWFLWRMYSFRDSFKVITSNPESELLHFFLKHEQHDIQQYFPDFDPSKLKTAKILLIIRNLKLVGLFIYQPLDEQRANVLIDYVTADVRDLKNAEYLYNHYLADLKAHGIKQLMAYSSIEAHKAYLLQIGFQEQTSQDNQFLKVVV